MEKSKWRRRLFLAGKVFGWFLLISVLFAFVCGWIAYVWPGPKFIGSPPASGGIQRNNLDLGDHGIRWGKWGKQFRPRARWDLGLALFAGPIVHYFWGWDVYNDSVCVKAQITDLAISGDDGDILITLLLEPNHTHYSWRMNHPEDESAGRNWILVEIDENIRKNFPIIPDLAIGDTVKVCGEWVYDRAHDHNEIHPAHWVEILEMGNAPKK